MDRCAGAGRDRTDTPFPTGLNDAIRAVAQEKGTYLVEWYALFLGKVNEYISQDLIHPNDTGHAGHGAGCPRRHGASRHPVVVIGTMENWTVAHASMRSDRR